MIKKKKEEFYSILCAVFLSVQSINHIIVAFLPSTKGLAMMILYLITGGLILVIAIIEMTKSGKVYASNAMPIFLVMIYYIFTLIMGNISDLEPSQFFSMTIVAMIAPMVKKINSKTFIKSLILLPLPGIFVLNKIFVTRGIRAEIIGMGLSYAFIPSIIATIVFLFKYFKESKYKLIYSIAMIVNLIYAWKVIQYGSRGPLLCIVSCFVLVLTLDIKTNGGIFFQSIKIFIISVIVAILLMNFFEILEWVLIELTGRGININAISKIFRLQQSSGDISNGRIIIWQTVAKDILKSPILGHGLSTTQYNLGIIYPHNFILQFLYDGGIILTVPIAYAFLRGVIAWFKRSDLDLFCIGVVLFSISLPGAFLSGNLWENGRLWFCLMFFATLNLNYFDKKMTNNTDNTYEEWRK